MMRRTVILLLLLASTAVAQMGTSAGHDLDNLWARAQTDHDLDNLDAVLLLESHEVTITDNLDLVTRVHRVVWVGTRAGQNAHADLRIPWNSATSSFEVEILRTWRDGRWWPDAERISDTAVVETLPHAVRTAWDYQDLRETMLLHDGVEAPCIMETAYVITERSGAAPGADRTFDFARREPSLVSEYVLTSPLGMDVRHEAIGGAPDPTITRDTDATRMEWTMSDLARRPLPSGSGMDGLPRMRWTTWGARIDQLAGHLIEVFDHAASIEPAMRDSVSRRLADTTTPLSRIRAVTTLVDDMVRTVRVRSFDRKLELRDAPRTWSTGYADAIDRAALVFALLKEAGLEPTPHLVEPDQGVDALGWPGRSGAELMIAVGHPPVFYDPVHGSLESATDVVVRTPWENPATTRDHGHHASLTVSLTRSDGAWSGSGSYSTSGTMTPWPALASDTDRGLDRLVSTAVPGAGAEGIDTEWSTSTAAVFGFDVTFEEPEEDPFGRIPISLASLSGGVVDRVPGGSDGWRPSRTSAIDLQAPMAQSLTLRLLVGTDAVVHAPEPRELTNDVGRFSLAVDHTDGVLKVTRELELTTDTIPAEQWPQLRALLLEEADPANRTILLRED